MTEHKLSLSGAMDFILAGNSTFTIVSTRTQTRFTYRVRKAEDKDLWFVKVLGNADSPGYHYIGMITDQRRFKLTRGSKLASTSTPVVGFTWLFQRLSLGIQPKDIEFWHAGRCGRCGRQLTTPESVAAGYGPDCLGLRVAA
ncbi:MAG TPA: DUF6011 domain-containing protein [Acidobacteriaceae bacterium]|nr:DUF6011 domain-containing protein [Acidobacteriaceae bacterium]